MRILIADDCDVSRLELQSLLTRHGHEVEAVADGTQAWDILRSDNPPRLAVLDWQMSDMDGVEVCRQVRQAAALRGIYLILLTSLGDTEHILAGLQAGANDYVTKPFVHQELLARIGVGEQMVTLQSELAARVKELDALSKTDSLTGIANRRSFQARLHAECQRASRYNLPLSLLIFDLDNFKRLNDTYGHPAGDGVLQTLGRLLNFTARNTDFVARYGGEEFAVILVNTDADAAKIAAERLRARIHSEPWNYAPVSASFGIATWEPGLQDAAELVSQADKALYHAKAAGRNRTAHWADLHAASAATTA